MRMARKKRKTSRRKPAVTYEESGFNFRVPQVIRDRPLDSIALAFAGAAAIAISVNAMMLQDARSPLRRVSPVAVATPAMRTPAASQAGTTAEDPNMLVREVQAELARRGLYDGPTDGLFGPKTEAAIFDFEIGAGLKPNGQPNPQLLAAMRSSSSPAVVPSTRVSAVQRVLDQQGFGPVKPDGVFGEATRAAIRRFEASRGLPQRGELTPAVLRDLSKISGVSFD
jgi:peptidoglycan hydrolase-like protein with peptidoglycan-binding domain